MAGKTVRNPISLYKQSLESFVQNLNLSVKKLCEIRALGVLPAHVLADIYEQMSKLKPLKSTLFEELCDINILARMIKYVPAREKVVKCIPELMLNGNNVYYEVAERFKNVLSYCDIEPLNLANNSNMTLNIVNGLYIGSFLTETGGLKESISILSTVRDLLSKMDPTEECLRLKFNCNLRILHAQANFCSFKEAKRTCKEGEQLIDLIGIDKLPKHLLANWYIELSVLHFMRSEYDLSYNWSIKALRLIDEDTPNNIIVDVLRNAAKSCVVKRLFREANMLISLAVNTAKQSFGTKHQKYADTLLDYGFFLLNVDAIVNSVKIYEEALNIRTKIYGKKNLHVATAHEDLAYALYVREYGSGQFGIARNHVEKAIEILSGIVTEEHLLLASARRVKALILEEIALDHMNFPQNAYPNELLLEAEGLHQLALKLALDTFGEVNVQTAKHYGNLGRLYQSMSKFAAAEKMHKKAIKIKTDLLGPYDYEVGLSIGHLASLYNYHMSKHELAEALYLRSIDISLKLFGAAYSGLEYDYRGLCYVYRKLDNHRRLDQYLHILDNWRDLRETSVEEHKLEPPNDLSLEKTIEKFFSMRETE